MKKYHTLLTFLDGRWTIQFGDYDRQVVKDEARDTKERGVKQRIITTSDKQHAIQAAVDELNRGLV